MVKGGGKTATGFTLHGLASDISKHQIGGVLKMTGLWWCVETGALINFVCDRGRVSNVSSSS